MKWKTVQNKIARVDKLLIFKEIIYFVLMTFQMQLFILNGDHLRYIQRNAQLF